MRTPVFIKAIFTAKRPQGPHPSSKSRQNSFAFIPANFRRPLSSNYSSHPRARRFISELFCVHTRSAIAPELLETFFKGFIIVRIPRNVIFVGSLFAKLILTSKIRLPFAFPRVFHLTMEVMHPARGCCLATMSTVSNWTYAISSSPFKGTFLRSVTAARTRFRDTNTLSLVCLRTHQGDLPSYCLFRFTLQTGNSDCLSFLLSCPS